MASTQYSEIDPAVLPATSSERVAVLTHFYRGELGRMAGWRDRIDLTSNWAITVVAAMLSLSLSTATVHHSVVIFSMLVVLLLLWIEARRYRFYDVYRDRVRLLERHYLAPVLEHGDTLETWRTEMAESLRHPRFNIGKLAAMAHRLRRNYAWMFVILFLAWLLKISTPLLQPAGTFANWREPIESLVAGASAGPLPGWIVIVLVVGLYIFLGWVLLRPGSESTEIPDEVVV